ncbi:uncharacterized protein [Zea mays]|uniref:uncharacterized protein n=1 Tax=Zea mays TaxID=4577 RepID=UPI0009AAC5CE|nr:uncharacterized protein LOC109943423 [Zea mays]|eukprot:XP_020401988.1 uncharacterized protein LOC109943423 [Zea mays]
MKSSLPSLPGHARCRSHARLRRQASSRVVFLRSHPRCGAQEPWRECLGPLFLPRRPPPCRLAPTSDDRTIHIWDLAVGGGARLPKTLTGHTNYVFCVSFSPHGNVLASPPGPSARRCAYVPPRAACPSESITVVLPARPAGSQRAPCSTAAARPVSLPSGCAVASQLAPASTQRHGWSHARMCVRKKDRDSFPSFKESTIKRWRPSDQALCVL